MDDNNNDEYQVRMYQDEIDTDPDATDPVIVEETDDPVEVLGVPADKLRDELDKEDHEDMREYIEDQDQDDDSPAIASR